VSRPPIQARWTMAGEVVAVAVKGVHVIYAGLIVIVD
jgi:hypothetical protein